MSATIGWYYLTKQGDLIFTTQQQTESIQNDDNVIGLWYYNGLKHVCWSILIEAAAAGAKAGRIEDLAVKWQLDDREALDYGMYLGLNCQEAEDGKKRVSKYDFTTVQRDHYGEGRTYMGAFIDLCKKLGYSPSKTSEQTFQSLIEM